MKRLHVTRSRTAFFAVLLPANKNSFFATGSLLLLGAIAAWIASEPTSARASVGFGVSAPGLYTGYAGYSGYGTYGGYTPGVYGYPGYGGYVAGYVDGLPSYAAPMPAVAPVVTAPLYGGYYGGYYGGPYRYGYGGYGYRGYGYPSRYRR